MSRVSPINKVKPIEIRTKLDRAFKANMHCRLCKALIASYSAEAGGQLYYSSKYLAGHKPNLWMVQVLIWGIPYEEGFFCLNCIDTFEYEVFVIDMTNRIVREATTQARKGNKYLVKKYEEWTNAKNIADVLKGGKRNAVHWF